MFSTPLAGRYCRSVLTPRTFIFFIQKCSMARERNVTLRSKSSIGQTHPSVRGECRSGQAPDSAPSYPLAALHPKAIVRLYVRRFFVMRQLGIRSRLIPVKPEISISNQNPYLRSFVSMLWCESRRAMLAVPNGPPFER